MESEFLDQWNAKFGAKPPEWVSTLTSQYSAQSLLEQDVDRELDNCQARIDKLRADLDQELFLVEWLRQQKANFSSGLSKPPTSTKTHLSHVQGGHDNQAVGLCSTSDDQPTEQSSLSLNGEVEEEKGTSPKQSSPLAQPGEHSPTSQLESHSEESVKSTPESLEYHTAPQSVAGDSSGTELEDQRKKSTHEVKENGFPTTCTPDISCRQRFAHKVDSSDVTIAKAVNQRLLEQQKLHSSCNVLNLDSVSSKLSPADKPVIRKRAASDPSSQRSEQSELFELKNKGGKRVLSSPIESPRLPKKELQKLDNSANTESVKLSVPEGSTNGTSDKLEKVVNTQPEEGDSEIIMTSEVEKRSSKEEDSIELRQWANLGPGKRSSNGILDNYEGYNIIVSPDEERDPALLNVLAGRIRSSGHGTPRSSIDHLRDPPPEAAIANGDNETKDNTSSPQRRSYDSQQTLVAELSPRRGVPPSLAKPERASLVFSEDECITPKGDSDHSMNIPTEDEEIRTKDRSRTLVGGQDDTLNVSRVEKLLEEVQRTQAEEGEDDPTMMTLTRNNTDKFRRYGEGTETAESSQEFTPLGSLDIDIQETLSKIQNAPDMSMATLLDVGENKQMNARFQVKYTDPSLDDFEYTQGIDDATISALTLSNELFGSRSNSVSSLPGLYSNSESSNTSISPPDMDSPSHARQGVNLRNTGGAKRGNRRRMGNADLDKMTGASDEGSDLSPSHTLSSRSMSPTSELGSLASLTMSPSSPREFSGSDSSGGIADSMVSLIPPRPPPLPLPP